VGTPERFFAGLDAYRVRADPWCTPTTNSAGSAPMPPALAGLLGDARALVRRHLPVNDRPGPCRFCGLEWPCPGYRRGRRVLQEHNEPRPLGEE
jgi:hypothetical protein